MRTALLGALLLFGGQAEASQIRGSVKLKAAQQATLAAQLPGNLTRIYVAEGQAFAKGAALFSSDCREPSLLLTSARNELASLNELLISSQKLLAAGAIDRSSVNEYKARAARVRGQVDQLQYQIGVCTVHAPFSGRVSKKLLRQNDWAQHGQGVLEIIGTDQLEADVIVPAVALVRLKVGDQFMVTIPAVGAQLRAQVRSFNAAADANSQTIGLSATLLDRPEYLRPGLVGEALFVVTP